MYMRKFLFLPLLSLLASCAKDDDCSPANVNPDNLVSPTPIPDRWKYFPANPMAVSM